MRRRALVATAALAVLATGGLVVLTQINTAPTAAPTPPPPPATDEVRRTDLVDQIAVDGKLGHGTPTPVTGRKSGTLTWLPPPGQVVDRGQPLYAVDAVGVPVLFGGVPPYRELGMGVPDGPDVAQLQENLIALGYLKGKASSKFTAAVEAAVKRWQKARHVDQSGRSQPGDVVVLAGPVRVAAVSARLGAPAEGDLLTVTGTDRLVTADLDETERPYATVGLKVRVRLADGRSVPGTVRETTDKAGEKASGLTITVALDDPGSAPDAGAVTVTLPGERRTDVLVVGVRALLALRDGGYAVEAVTENGSRQQVPVRLGMFANGLVEISGTGLRAGMKVVTTT